METRCSIIYKYKHEKKNRVDEGAGGSERSPRFVALSSTRGGPFRLLLPPPCPPASTAPGEGLHGGMLEGSCGRRRHRGMINRLNVGTCAPASEYGTFIRRRSGKKNRLYIYTITDKTMICAISILRLLFAECPSRKVLY